MPKPTILAFAGSAREGSYNKKLIRLAAAAARDAGGDVTLIDLRDFPMPMYDGDAEQVEGIPPDAKRFKELMKGHQALVIASPEYNSAISPLLKNAIDWASRPEPGEPSLVAFTGKVAAITSASTGQLGGLRGLVTVRGILGNIGVVVLPEQLSIPNADKAFRDDGAFAEERHGKTLDKIARRLVDVASRLNG